MRSAFVLRALVVGLALLAALDPTLDARPPRTRVVIVDQSRSLARGKGRVMALARAAIADLEPGDRVAVVRLGAEAAPLAAVPAPEADLALAAAVAAPVDPRGTRLDLALRAALDVGGPGAEVVLVSDGRETGGDALAAAAELAAAGGRLVAAIPDAAPPLGVRVARLEVAARAAAGARLPVEVEVATAAGDPRRVEVVLEVAAGDPAAVTSLRAAGQVGPRAPLVLRFTTPPLPGPGHVRLRARVVASGPDDAPEDDAREALVVTGGARRALVVAAVGAGDAALEPVGAALRAAGLTVEVVAPAGLAAALQVGPPPDLVVLSDVRWSPPLAEALPALARAVEAGAGLAAVGCESAFGPGGWAGTPLEALLPVRCGPGRERERPLAVAVALDNSGSMQGVVTGSTTRWRQAVPAALSGADEGGPLEVGDGLAVLVFSASATPVRPLAPLTADALEALRTDLLGRRPTGATDVAGGLVAALDALAGAAPGPDGKAPERLAIVVTDAADPGARDRAAEVSAARARLGAGPLHVLVVVVGATLAEAAPVRALVAPLGDEARVEVAADADAELRKLLQGELAAQRLAVRRGRFPVLLTGQALARGLAWPGPVALLATVRLRGEGEAPGDGDAAVELLARAKDEVAGDPPLLALGRRGAGRTLAVPTAPDVAAPLVLALAGELAPPHAEGATLVARRTGDLVQVTVEGADLPPLVEVTAKDGEGRATAGVLVGAAPDRLQGALPAPSGLALDLVALAGAGRVLARGQLPALAADELAGDGPDAARLQLLCEATGGRVVPALPAPASAWSAAAGGGARRLAPFAALAALVALLAEAARAALSVRRAPVRAG